jgi:hypothetical protein
VDGIVDGVVVCANAPIELNEKQIPKNQAVLVRTIMIYLAGEPPPQSDIVCDGCWEAKKGDGFGRAVPDA